MRLITAASASAFLASQAFGHPTSATPRRTLLGRVVDLNAFRLATVTEYSNSTNTTNSISANLLFKRDDYVDAATALVEQVVPSAEFRLVDDHYVSTHLFTLLSLPDGYNSQIGTNGIAHVNFKQTVHQLDIDNADFNVNVSTTLVRLEVLVLIIQQDCQRWQRVFLRKLFLLRSHPFRKPSGEARSS